MLEKLGNMLANNYFLWEMGFQINTVFSIILSNIVQYF